MLRVALTGAPAAGKSEVAKIFAELGVPVFDADAAVHDLYRPGGAAVAEVARLFPAARAAGGGIDRRRLADIVLADPAALRRLEAVVHPLVRTAREDFFAARERAGAPLAVAEIPLLFETGDAADFDVVITVTAPDAARRRRALARPGMTEERLAAMEARHLPPAHKARRADIVIRNDAGREELRRRVRAVHRRLLAMAGG